MNSPHTCPACGKQRCPPDKLVCPECYQTYLTEASKKLVELASEEGSLSNANGEGIDLVSWLIPRAKNLASERARQLIGKQDEYNTLQADVHASAMEAMRKTTGSKMVPREVFNEALRGLKDKMWKERGGNRLHYELKTLESETALLRGTVEGLQKKQANQPEPEADTGNEGVPGPGQEPEQK